MILLKRIIDVLFSSIIAIVILPVVIVISLLIYKDVGRPIIFKQKRVGRNEGIFSLYKFRTMSNECDLDGKLLPNEKRLSSLGRIIRSTSLDELPSIVNILRGEMSLVGPRPLLVDYLPFYKKVHRKRHSVQPGLTGLAQIRGRNLISWQKRLDSDIEYIEKQSIYLDFKILILTGKKVIIKEGIEGSEGFSIVRLDKDTAYLNSENEND